ncbi:thioesterase [Variovorax sp. WS11]|uniref:thioesterase II family protein n=1 Tax=Variovorax sp. WS11 TaxID=1105204 RepID=UPI000D0D6239|nr:alpha/beta fold hydrolase [Variovorax sp. WS11]NDZ18117.1 thioesterase [Variovorax sp. WS11]PSL79928.1 thioesterase [Variovorax sp. WS11]
MRAAVSLLCLPCAGASATMYLRWRRLLPRWIEVVPVELPGRGARLAEPFASDFDALVAQLCAEQSEAMRGPFAFFGHSMGALLAWGLADRLRTLGRGLPCALLASGSAAPSQRDPDRFAGKNDDASLIADLRKQGGTPEEVFASEELMRITLDVLGADYRVCGSFGYAAAAPLPVPLHVFAGRDDDIEPQRIEAWSAEAADTFTLDWFDGGHFFIRQHEAAVLAVLVQRLAKTLAPDAHAAAALA